MASIDVGIHPDPGQITSRRFAGKGPDFNTLDLGAGGDDKVVVFVSTRPVLDALQAALDEIRADMDKAAAAFPARGEITQVGPSSAPGYWTGTAKRAAVQAAVAELEYVTGASDQVPTVMADWPAMAAMAPGELMEIHGK